MHVDRIAKLNIDIRQYTFTFVVSNVKVKMEKALLKKKKKKIGEG